MVEDVRGQFFHVKEIFMNCQQNTGLTKSCLLQKKPTTRHIYKANVNLSQLPLHKTGLSA